MQCSSCHAPVRPVVAFDIDGTIGNYHDHFTAFCIMYWDLDKTFPHRNEFGGIISWDGEGGFEDYFRLTKAEYREAKLAYRQGGLKRSLPMYPGVKSLIDGIRNRGVEVWIATTRPWQRLDNIDPDTREWLRRNDLGVDGLLFGEDKYRRLIASVEREAVIGVVDDLIVQVREADILGLPAYLRRNNHNVGVNWDPSGNLDSVGAWLHSKIQDWEVKNAH